MRENSEMKQKILLTACERFNENGYENTSLDMICLTAGISKGIIYYYFHSKDDLYLHCVKGCFDAITNYLKEYFYEINGELYDYVQQYFQIRREFLYQHPHFHNLFYNNLVSPPVNLFEEIKQICAPFEQYNAYLIKQIFYKYPLSDQFTMEEALQHIRMYQNGIYITFSKYSDTFQEKVYEETCLKSVKIIMTGLLQKKL